MKLSTYIIAVISGVIANIHYKIRLAKDPNLALIIRNGHVGFIDLKHHSINPEDEEIEIKNGLVGRDGKNICRDVNSENVGLCVTNIPVFGIFKRFEADGKSFFMQNGEYVLAIGDYDYNVEMYPLKSIHKNTSKKEDYLLDIKKYKDGRQVDEKFERNKKLKQ